jgi:hypothetical protein
MRISLGMLKRALLAFWAAWLTLAAAANVLDGCGARGIGPARAAGASNYRSVHALTRRAAAPRWVGDLLFAGVILWQAVSAGLFWWAAARYRATPRTPSASVNHAFLGGLGLWAAFLVADELVAAHDTGVEAAHMRAFTAQLATLVSVYVLPD